MKTILLATMLFATIHISSAQNCQVSHSYNFSGIQDNTATAEGTLHGGAIANGTLSIGSNNVDYIQLPSEILDGLTDFTITFNIKFNAFNLTGNSATNHILSGSIPSNSDSFAFAYQKSIEKFVIAINSSSYSFPTICETNIWYCYTISRTENQIKFFLNGVQMGSTQNCVTSPINIDPEMLFIGQEQDCTGGCLVTNQAMNGEMDNFQIYNCGVGSEVRCTNVLAVEEFESTNQLINVFPNPATDEINFMTEQRVTDIQLIDLKGRTFPLMISSTEDGFHNIKLTEKSTGTYILNIRLEDGTQISKKIILQ